MDQIHPNRAEWLSPAQVAAETGYSYHAVHVALRSGRLKGGQPSGPRGKWLIHRSQVEAWINGKAA